MTHLTEIIIPEQEKHHLLMTDPRHVTDIPHLVNSGNFTFAFWKLQMTQK